MSTKDSKSISGYVFTLGGGVGSWNSSKKTILTWSTMESKFIALNKAAWEAEWIWNFLEDIPNWSNWCLQYVYIMIAKQLLEGHKILCIMESLDIYD